MARVVIAGVDLGYARMGSGPPVLYLHPEHFHDHNRPFIAALSGHGEVIAPVHPGFDGRPPPPGMNTVEDIAYLYLDLLRALDLREVLVMGVSLGGWIAMEMAVRDTGRMRAISLVAPLGIKAGNRETRDFADLWAMPEADAHGALFGDPNTVDYATLDADAMTRIAVERHSLAHYAWKPYLHNPVLGRWLHRIDVPVQLLRGESDGYVFVHNTETVRARIGCGPIETIDAAGHYPQLENPKALLAALTRFAASSPDAGRRSTGTGTAEVAR